jgi:hypothetical protein
MRESAALPDRGIIVPGSAQVGRRRAPASGGAEIKERVREDRPTVCTEGVWPPRSAATKRVLSELGAMSCAIWEQVQAVHQ